MAFLSRIFRGWSLVLQEITCSFCSVLTDHKFASAGREDIDVRMLGNGKSQSLPLSLGQLQERGLWPDPNWKSATHVLRSFQLKTDGLTILNDYSTHAQKSGLARCWPENNWSQGTVHYRCVSLTMREWEQSEQTKGGKNTYPTPLRSCSFNPAPQLAFFFFFFHFLTLWTVYRKKREIVRTEYVTLNLGNDSDMLVHWIWSHGH